jgi:hypothetical protein
MAAVLASSASKRRTWSSHSFRMEIWATILGAEVAVVTIALLCYDWRVLFSPLP